MAMKDLKPGAIVRSDDLHGVVTKVQRFRPPVHGAHWREDIYVDWSAFLPEIRDGLG